MTLVATADFPLKKTLNLAAIKTMVAAAEAEAARRNVPLTICIVDESLNLLFMQKGDRATISTISFAHKKARHSAYYRSASSKAAERVRNGEVALLVMPESFPNEGGLPIQVDGLTIGGIGVSGAPSEDEAIGQAALDALFRT